jgi:UDP-N-acetylmuramoyl-tripeptide--D-alanyl-D-alanine ligase
MTATPIPTNSAVFSLGDLARATGASVQGDAGCVVRGVTTDSRADVAGKLFVALPGVRYDGHAFLSDVVARGASAVLVERDQPGLLTPVLRVASTLGALGAIARQHRSRWRGKLVAIAGSAGKTTTRVACQSMFEVMHPGKVLGTAGNLNNQVGVPMTLLGLTEAHEYAVVEVGTNQPGEVKCLATLCQPDVALLTLVGLEHSEGLGDIDAIELEEGGILEALSPLGIAIGNGDDPRVIRQMNQRASNARHVRFGTSASSDYSVTQQLGREFDRSIITVRRSEAVGGGQLRFESRLCGTPGAMAAAAALAAVEALGARVGQGQAQSAFQSEQLGEKGRLQVLKLAGDIMLLDDSYNANPPSMTSSIAVAADLAQRRASRLVLVLGEMLELGPLSEREHRRLGANLGDASMLVAVGNGAEALFDSAQSAGVRSEFFKNAEDAAERTARLVQNGDVVLVKGSRGVKLEKVVQKLAKLKGYAA